MTKIALVSCVKTKRSEKACAKDLYVSPLFCGMRAYAEANADQWFILSAEHGLLSPESVVSPYERTLNTMKVANRREWAEKVQEQLLTVLPSKADVIMLAGQRYRENLMPFLESRGHLVSVPFLGLPLGHQLSLLNQLAAYRLSVRLAGGS